MRERLVTLALAAGAFVLFYLFFVPKPPAPSDRDDLPLSTEVREHGYQGLWRWLRGQQIPVESLRQPYTQLARRSGRTGDVLVATVPGRLGARRRELDDLDAWVARGNTLLVMAALDDTPTWALAADPTFLASLTRMTQLKFETVPQAAPDRARPHRAPAPAQPPASQRALQAVKQVLEPEHIVVAGRGSQPLFEGVHSVLAVSEFPASHWKAVAADPATALLEVGERAQGADASAPHEPAVWLRRHGEGQILVIAFASIFENAMLGERDNARLFANIIAWSRSPKGAVIFDDDHQGAVEYYDAKAFLHDPRLHRTLLWAVALWLLFVLGWQRLRPTAETWNPPDVTSFIGTTGEFFAAALAPAAAAERLFDNFFHTVRRRLALPEQGAQIWDRMAADARIHGRALDELRRLHARTQTGQRVDLMRLQDLTSRLLGNLE